MFNQDQNEPFLGSGLCEFFLPFPDSSHIQATSVYWSKCGLLDMDCMDHITIFE